MRSRRYGSARPTMMARPVKVPRIFMIGPMGTPPMNRIPKAMQLSTRAVPMSGCFRMRTPEMPRTASTGTITIFGSEERSARRVSRSAAKTARASFISSDGCSWNMPTPIHRDEPPAVTPKGGTSTRTSRPMVTTTRGPRTDRHFR